jgi:hypothetical protein
VRPTEPVNIEIKFAPLPNLSDDLPSGDDAVLCEDRRRLRNISTSRNLKDSHQQHVFNQQKSLQNKHDPHQVLSLVNICGGGVLVVKVPGYRFRSPGSIPGASRFFLRSSGSGTGSNQPRDDN